MGLILRNPSAKSIAAPCHPNDYGEGPDLTPVARHATLSGMPRPSKEVPAGLEAYELTPGKVLFVHPFAATLEDARLSPAEREVVALLLQGRDNASIARLRGTSVRTIANQVASIFSKLGVHSRSELAVRALG
jgi:DNA-binding CsgD family transcriptional regulator